MLYNNISINKSKQSLSLKITIMILHNMKTVETIIPSNHLTTIIVNKMQKTFQTSRQILMKVQFHQRDY